LISTHLLCFPQTKEKNMTTPPESTADNLPKKGSETLDNKRVWKALAGVGIKDAMAEDAKEMVLICAGLGRTGTSSLKLALKQIGLTPYHMADGVMETKGHMDLWVDYAVQPALDATPPTNADQMDGASGRQARAKSAIQKYGYAAQGENIVTVIQGMAAAGFDSATDMPACYIWRALAHAHPNAKVFLTRRETGEKWATSVLATIGQNIPVFSQAPFKHVPMMQKGLLMNHWMWAAIGVPADLWGSDDWTPEGELGQSLAASHDAWAETVREEYREMTDGASEVVEIIAKDGAENWLKLAELLGESPYAEKCRARHAAGEPWPHENETAEMLRIYGIFKTIIKVWSFAPFIVVAIIVAIAALAM